VSGSRYTSAGQGRVYYPEFDERISIDPRAVNNGFAENNDAEDANNFFTSLRYGDFSFSAFRNVRMKEVPTASFGTVFNDPREETEDIRSYLDLRYDHRFTNDWSLQARVFYDEYKYSGVYPFDFAEPGFPPDILLARDETVGEWLGTEWQLTAQVRERHTVIVGAEYRDNLQEFQSAYYDVDPRDYYILDDRSSHTLGVFAQSETELTEKLLFTAGLRYDRYSSETGNTLNPRLGLIYSPSNTDTLKVLYGEAFRAPNPYERYYYVEQANRPALDPETIHTSEIAYEKQLGERYRLTVAGYYYHVRDLVSQAATDLDEIYFGNVDSARAKGLEVEIDRQFASGATLRASYALQEAVDGLSDVELSNSPRDIAKLNLSLPFAGDRLNAGFEVRYHSSVWTLRGNRIDDFVTANVTLFNHRTTGGLELSGTVYNIFDERYSYPGAEDHLQDALEQSGRMFQGKLTYRF
jgi:outer membrane receptor for ferrienterochelin and colicins